MQKYLIFGGTGFIGSHLCYKLMLKHDVNIIIVSRNNIDNSFWLKNHNSFQMIQHIKCDLKNVALVEKILLQVMPTKIVFCAGENPSILKKTDDVFVKNNIINVLNFLNCCLKYYRSLNRVAKKDFTILNVTTYEIYSKHHDSNFSVIQPKTIYSATKASAFHLFNAWNKTYGLPIMSAICANNYGCNQSGDKLIPMTLNNLTNRTTINLFNSGLCKRNWIHVEDTSYALYLILKNGVNGKVYNIGSENYLSNKTLILNVINIYANIKKEPIDALEKLINICVRNINNVYSHNINCNNMYKDLLWEPQISMETGLNQTIQWYLNKNNE